MSAADRPTGSRAKVLVANGEPVMHALVRATLAEASYTVVEARDGEEALVRTRDDRPDLIVLDMMMPRRSGPQVLAALRRDPATAATPVIMLTTRARTAETLDGACAERYLAKPFSPLRFASLVEELLDEAADAA